VVFPNVITGLKGRDAVAATIRAGEEASAAFQPLIKHPHVLEYEKTFFPLLLFAKKRYCSLKYGADPDATPKRDAMGIVLKRRDNCGLVKDVYGGVLDIILHRQDIPAAAEFLRSQLADLVAGKVPLEKLVITKALRAEYSDPTRIAHKVLADRLTLRDPGSAPQVNDRLPYVYVRSMAELSTSKTKKVLQGDRIEHPDFVRANTGRVKPDYAFYVSNQLMKPLLQLFALAVERLPGVRQNVPKLHYSDDKAQKEREAEVKRLLLQRTLVSLENKEQKNRVITDFFKA
jgi:DNA polymerase elongation subunit (family B)